MCHFFILLNDPEKDVKVLAIVRSRGFFVPKKVNAHGLSNFIESRKSLRKTLLIRSRGFNKPKKVNAHSLSMFRESGKNLRKTSVDFAFPYLVHMVRKNHNSILHRRLFKSCNKHEKKQDRSTSFHCFTSTKFVN